MTFLPGRARLSTNPAPTGLPAWTMTMGIRTVAPLRRRAGGNGDCNDHVHLECHQLARKCRQAIQYAFCIDIAGIRRRESDVRPPQLAASFIIRLQISRRPRSSPE